MTTGRTLDMLSSRVPNVMIDARKLGDGGIGAYIENLVDGLLALREDGEIAAELSLLVEETVVASSEERARHLRMTVREARGRWENRVRFIPERSGKYSLSEYLRLASRQRHELRRHQLFHAPHYTLPLFLKIPTVATIHDVIHLTHPSTRYHEPVARALLRSVAKRADRIITVSEHSRDVLLRELPIRTDRLHVVKNCLRPGISPRSPKEVSDFLEKEKLESDYCLFVGSDMPHKGFAELVETWAQLFSDVDTAGYPQLFVVGRGFDESWRKLVQEKGLELVIRFLGEVSDRRLSLLYSGARALVFPSHAEGFGFPVLEAMSCGVPVVSTPLPSVREFGEGVVWFSAGFDPQSFGRTLQRALQETPREVLRLEKGKRRAAELTLRDAARSTWKVYQSLLFPESEQISRTGSRPWLGSRQWLGMHA